MTSVGAYSFHTSSLLRRVARMQLRDTVRDPSVEAAASTRGRIPSSVRLRALMDAASIAVVRAQMNLLERYITICVRGDFRVLAAADRRRAAARVSARAGPGGPGVWPAPWVISSPGDPGQTWNLAPLALNLNSNKLRLQTLVNRGTRGVNSGPTHHATRAAAGATVDHEPARQSASTLWLPRSTIYWFLKS